VDGAVLTPRPPALRPSRDAIRGLRLRPYGGSADLEALAAVRAAQEAFDGDDEESVDADSLAALFAHPLGWEPSTDVTIAELHGRIVGWGRVEHQAFVDEDAFRSRGYVLPAFRGRGIGAALLTAGEARLQVMASSTPGSRPRWFHGWVTDHMPRAAALFRRAGYAPFHSYVEMERLADLPNPELTVLDPAIGIGVPSPGEYLAFYRVLSSAFAGQWGTRSMSDREFEALIARVLADPAHDPALWRVARVDGRIVAGVEVAFDAATGAGVIDSLGTMRDHRHRGVGSAMLAAAIDALRERGAREILLSVDTENVDALGLYERFGFRVCKRGIGYRKPLPG
jgi:mycothiol synthase